ncbi:hypothetical protein [Nonomuraea sp. NPDC049504]|uniref:hypothetical protein n=1 Tax=Nonomuraea sp. NPDC049504 TaxID=3154729 RepID=UPI00343B6573
MTVVGKVVVTGAIAAGSIALGNPAQAAMTTQHAGSSSLTASASSAWPAATSQIAPGEITSPSDGEVVTSSSVPVSARAGLLQLKVGLYVEGPSTPSQTIGTGSGNQTISGTFNAGDAPNGTFTVTLKGEITGTTYASSTFTLRRPAQAPADVRAGRRGAKKVLVTWRKGPEPDLQSYEVSSTQSGLGGRMPVDSACSGSSCRAELAVPAQVAGKKVGFAVTALRGDGSGGSIGSEESAMTYVSFPAAPSAKPTKKKPADTGQTAKNKGPTRVDALPILPGRTQTRPSSKPSNRKAATSPESSEADPNANLLVPSGEEGPEKGGGPATSHGRDGAGSAPGQTGGVTTASGESPLGNIGQYGWYATAGILLLLLGVQVGGWARRRSLAAAEGGVAASPSSAGRTPGPAGGAYTLSTAQGTKLRRADGMVTPVTSASRRPAVIVSVAKTRVSEQEPHMGTDGAASASGSSEGSPPRGVSSSEGSPPRGVSSSEGSSAPYVSSSEGAASPSPSGGAADGSASLVLPSVPIDERWNDFLPPTPRSMEDSAFWTRSQAGDGDFWETEGDGDGAYSGRARRNGKHLGKSDRE